MWNYHLRPTGSSQQLQTQEWAPGNRPASSHSPVNTSSTALSALPSYLFTYFSPIRLRALWGSWESIIYVCVPRGVDSKYSVHISSRTEEMKNTSLGVTYYYLAGIQTDFGFTVFYATSWVGLNYHFGNPNEITIISFPTNLKFE